MNIEKITYEYYSKILGVEINKEKTGTHFVHNPERDKTMKGYSQPIDVYVFVSDEFTIVSYGNKAKTVIEEMLNKLEAGSLDTLDLLLKNTFTRKINKSIKYIYRNKKISALETVILKPEQYNIFLEFFKTNNPKIQDYSWVKDYFIELSSKNYCHGIIIDNKLVCATDAPNMPFMEGIVQEIGINTIEGYRGRGYAQSVCVSLINKLLLNKICPLWSAAESNIASDRLAKSIGFERLSEVLSFSIFD